ncbi:MAG: SHOCT domain-containing protein [Thaumarchaeota archaeon]|nr:SHOCT domain-containing protein [Nitrososphaerota archaeon]
MFSLAIIPAYAEVESLQTDRPSYATYMNMYFTGTVDKADAQKSVNLVIHDPYGKLVLITSNASDSNGIFHIIINTNDPNQFSLKGTYGATAFVTDESGGKTISFDFSPDGSPVNHQTSTQNNSQTSQNIAENNTVLKSLNLQHSNSIVEHSVNITDTVTVSKINSTVYHSEQSSTSYDFKNILYPLMAICGAGIVGLILYLRKKKCDSETTDNKESELSSHDDNETKDDYALMVLKSRLAKGEITLEEFKTLKDILNES